LAGETGDNLNMTRENCISGILFALASVVLVGVLGSQARADDLVVLKNQSRFEGRIISDTLDTIKIETDFGVIEFPKRMVQKVVKAGTKATGPKPLKGLYRPAPRQTKACGIRGSKSGDAAMTAKRTLTGAPARTTTKPGFGRTKYGRGKPLPRFDWDTPSVWRSKSSSGSKWFLPSKKSSQKEALWKLIQRSSSPSKKTNARRVNRNRRTHQRNLPVWRQNCNQVKRVIRRRGG
jgi:hypothetical protein